MKEVEITFGGERLLLSPLRAVYWPEKETLILSDLHVGKSAHFRKNGIPVPNLVSESDIARLEKLLEHYPSRQMIIVGDLIHAGMNSDSIHFQEWLKSHPEVRVSLIKGNHDRIKPEKLLAWGLHEVIEEGRVGSLLFTHDAPKNLTQCTISGHLHPGVLLDMPFKKRLKLPCFIVTPTTLVLPAFSEFTGLDTSNHPEQARYYAIVGHEVLKI